MAITLMAFLTTTTVYADSWADIPLHLLRTANRLVIGPTALKEARAQESNCQEKETHTDPNAR